MQSQHTFFRWQERALLWLLGWGAGNVAIGAAVARAADEVARHIGRQAVAWGAIDLLLAVNGRRAARRQATTTSDEQAPAAVARFRTILAVNAVLDVCYVLGGLWLARTAGARRDRLGTGLGVMLQGVFLGCYDAALLRGAARWRQR